jgi:hypothetical protein
VLLNSKYVVKLVHRDRMAPESYVHLPLTLGSQFVTLKNTAFQ